MAQLSDDDWKEIYIADLYAGMQRRSRASTGDVYSEEMFEAVDDLINEMHSENDRLS